MGRIQVISQRKFVRAVSEVGVSCLRRDTSGTCWRGIDGKLYAEFVGDGKKFIYWRVG